MSADWAPTRVLLNPLALEERAHAAGALARIEAQ